MASANPAAASTSSTTSGSGTSRLDNLKAQLGVVDDLLLAGFKNAQPTTPTQQAKEPLSLQTTSNNFRRFVQKSGPIFIAQDAAEALLRWEDAPTTLFFAAAWAFICHYPYLLIILPNLVLTAILLSTYHNRPSGGSTGSSPTTTTTNAATPPPPAEGSIDYLANLRNIQIMMGRVSAGSDFAMANIVPYLTWQDTRLSLFLLQIAVLSGMGLLWIAPYVPWRIVLLIGGEVVFFAGHPVVVAILGQATPYLAPVVLRAQTKVAQLIEEDSLPDSELEGQVVLVEKLEVEAFREGGWAHDTELGGSLPKGGAGGTWSWSKGLGGEGWKIDGSYHGGDLDPAGFVYLHLDGTLSSNPIRPGSTTTAPTRRRRWVRRAVKLGGGDVD